MDKGLREFAERNARGLYPDERVTLARGNTYNPGPLQREAFVDGVDLGYKTCMGQILDQCNKVRKTMELDKLSEAEFDFTFSVEYQLTIKIKLQYER